MTNDDARDALLELHARWALAADEGRAAEWAALFTEDGVFVHPVAGEIVGRTDLEEFMESAVARRGGQSRHVITNVTLEVDGRVATGRCYQQRFVVSGGRIEHTSIGRFDDEFSEVDGRWLLRRRVTRAD